MDVNGTKFHLLLDRADWASSTDADAGRTLSDIWKHKSENLSPPVKTSLAWNTKASELTLQPRLFQFISAPKDEKPDLQNRRGAARDRYGNWYLVDETGFKIRVLSVGSNRAGDFYPTVESDCEETRKSDFQPVGTTVKTPVPLRGLAVTVDHYLVVGTLEPAGLLIFDLYSTGAPRRVLWRKDVEFAPFDISARPCGGVFVLDRTNRRYWTLDRAFNATANSAVTPTETADEFQPLDASTERKRSQNVSPNQFFSPLALEDPMAIEALPDDTVLILNRRNDEEFSIIYRYYRERRLDELNTKTILSLVEEEQRADFRLRGYDIAFVAGDEASEQKLDRVYVASEAGNQAFAFELVCESDIISSPDAFPSHVVKKHFELEPVAEYFPLRLFGGRGFAAAGDKVYYDFTERFLPLVAQRRPRYVEGATLITRAFDGKEPDCVWHRLLIDACLPPETSVEVWSRTAEEPEDLELSEWRREPRLYLRGDGAELPFVRRSQTSKTSGEGVWELLLQRAKGRFLQLKLALSGNGQKTPRLHALRVYYPRFSYLKNYLPAIYREDEQSASFLDRFLANLEGIYTTTEGRIAAAQMLFDVRSAPSDALEWLAGWFGAVLDPAWDEAKRRMFIKHAAEFFEYRGTLRGLRMALRLALDSCADERIFSPPTFESQRFEPVRIIERWQTRRTPEIIPDDEIDSTLPRIVLQTARWNPKQGADVLHQRYRDKLGEPDNQDRIFTLSRPDDAKETAAWEEFALEVLGFVPSTSTARTEKLWQDFLARRYRRIGRVNEVYTANFASFDEVPLFDELPFAVAPLADWFQFESVVLAMHRTAHRFTVLVPVALGANKPESATEQLRKLDLVRRVVELEKPAHTVFDVRFYWNLFRVGEARLGADTLLGLGSRDPQLTPEFVVGQAYIGETRLSVLQPEKYAERYVIGTKAIKQT